MADDRRFKDARLASVLQQLLNEYGIWDVESFAACVGGDAGDHLANWMLSDGGVARLQLESDGTFGGSTVDAATATDGTDTVDKSCTASFSSAGARLVSMEVQTCFPRSSQAVQAAVGVRHVGTGMQQTRAVDCGTLTTTTFAALKDAALEVAGRETRALVEPILTRAAEAGEVALEHVSAERAAVEELRAAWRASNERRAAEAAAAAADRAAVTRREQQLQTTLETERALHAQARYRVDRLRMEVAEMQGLLQQTMQQLEHAKLQSEC